MMHGILNMQQSSKNYELPLLEGGPLTKQLTVYICLKASIHTLILINNTKCINVCTEEPISAERILLF